MLCTVTLQARHGAAAKPQTPPHLHEELCAAALVPQWQPQCPQQPQDAAPLLLADQASVVGQLCAEGHVDGHCLTMQQHLRGPAVN
jgi:hypothetical protein